MPDWKPARVAKGLAAAAEAAAAAAAAAAFISGIICWTYIG